MRVTAQVWWPGSSARRFASTLSSLIHPREAFTQSQCFWSAVCQRLLPLKRRWQPLIITQAERGAFLWACFSDLCLHTQMPPGLRRFTAGLTNEPRCFVLLDVMVGTVWTQPENPELDSAPQQRPVENRCKIQTNDQWFFWRSVQMRKDFQTSQVCPLKARLPQEHKSALLDGAKTQPMWFSCRCWLRFSSGPPAANVLQQVGPKEKKTCRIRLYL